MKILIINYEFPPLGGGAGNASYFIAREMAKAGHEVIVYTSHFKGLVHREVKDGFTIIRIPVKRNKIDACTIFEMMTFLLSGLWHISKIKREFTPSVVLAFFTIPCAPIAWYLKMRWSIPYLTLLRGGDVPGFKGIGRAAAFVHVMLKPLTRILWKHSLAVIANSRGLAELARKTWNGQIHVVHNGVDTDYFKPALTKKSADHVRILFAGRLSEQKGLKPFLEILKDLQTCRPWKMTIVGDGPLRSQLEQLVNQTETLSQKVEFKGWLNKENLLNEYQQSDIFILPSLDEGMPNVLLEAMACGLPVLTTRIAGNEELIIQGENGFLYNPNDSKSAIEYLIGLIDNNELAIRISDKNRKYRIQKNWNQAAHQLFGLFSE